jgi:hypothetical protein
MQQDAQRLLLVDDDLRLSEMLRDYLTSTNCLLYINALTLWRAKNAPETLVRRLTRCVAW